MVYYIYNIIMEDSYKNKYIKYKNKYMSLKNKLEGGVNGDEKIYHIECTSLKKTKIYF
jgi:hypothetical protein